MMTLAQQVTDTFQAVFKKDPLVVRSPGRINLIGEHTDYNNGFVLPAAIDKEIFAAFTKSASGKSHFIALDMNDEYTGTNTKLVKQPGHWSVYINGIIDQLQRHGYAIPEFNCVIGGNIPVGAGMSSSAAVECAVLFGLNELFGLGIDKLSIVKMAQKAENEYAGVQCGIMDQFANMFGKKGHVIKLDCQSLEYEYRPFELQDISIVLFDTNVKHSLASSEYNNRRKECEKGVEMLRHTYPGIKSLRDVTLDMVEEYLAPIGGPVYSRCKYVVEENGRLQTACDDLMRNDIEGFGKKMFATHEGLSKLYEVSCSELDYLVDAVKKESGVLGARMMGGGFGGCTINLVKNVITPVLIPQIKKEYEEKFKRPLGIYTVSVENGTAIYE